MLAVLNEKLQVNHKYWIWFIEHQHICSFGALVPCTRQERLDHGA